MKKNIIILIALLCNGLMGLAQSDAITNGYKQIPREQVYIHSNTQVLFTGEYLYYKVYCTMTDRSGLSDVSKVAYVALVNKKGKEMFKHTIRLEGGIGQGDYFIPIEIPSGSYKLIGYTQWMRNEGVAAFFTSDVLVINPYTNNQEAILDGRQIISSVDQIPESLEDKSATISLTTMHKKLEPGMQQSLQISGGLEKNIDGDYSISVRKYDVDAGIDKLSMSKPRFTKKGMPIGIPNYLPELRGKLIKGSLQNKVSALPIENVKVGLSIPGESFITKIASSQKDGLFYFIMDETFNGENVIIQVLGAQAADYSIVLDTEDAINYNGLVFPSYDMDIVLKNTIQQRSVYNQIENGYFSQKPDTIVQPLAGDTFYGDRGLRYVLDDYKRFPSVKETVVEFIEDAWVTTEDDETSFVVRPYANAIPSNFRPLVIIDGVIVQDHETLLAYEAKKIKAITVVRDKYFLGADVHQGILIAETFSGDFYALMKGPHAVKTSLETSKLSKQYFKQSAPSEETKRIPDYRSQLLWEPRATISGREHSIEFYTSHNTGIYEVTVEGIMTDGTPVSLLTYFEVVDAVD